MVLEMDLLGAMESTTVLFNGLSTLEVLALLCWRLLFCHCQRFLPPPAWIMWCNLHLLICWYLIASCVVILVLCPLFLLVLALVGWVVLVWRLLQLVIMALKYFCWCYCCVDKGAIYSSTFDVAPKSVTIDGILLLSTSCLFHCISCMIFFLLYTVSLHGSFFCCLVVGVNSLSCGWFGSMLFVCVIVIHSLICTRSSTHLMSKV